MSSPLAALLDVNPGPVRDRPTVALDPYAVYAFETRTGRVAARIPYVGQPSWSLGLNTAGDWRVTVPLGTSDIDLETLNGVSDPWRYSWAICQGTKIWQAGPVVSENYQGGNTTTFTGGGLLKYWSDKRLLLNPARASASDVASSAADLCFGPTGYTPVIGGTVAAGNRDLSLHTILKRLFELTNTATGAGIPLVLPADIAGSAIREYPGYDLASVGQRALELSQVIGGPEFQFVPEFADPATKASVRWVLRIGNPRLGNLGFAHVWDHRKALIDSVFDTDGGYRITRDFERGNGMNRDLVTGYADVAMGPNPSDLLLERAGSDHTSATSTSVLTEWASAAVADGQAAAPTITHTVRTAGDDGNGFKSRSPHTAEIACGDNMTAYYTMHPRLGSAAIACRIVAMTSTGRPSEIELQTQTLGVVNDG